MLTYEARILYNLNKHCKNEDVKKNDPQLKDDIYRLKNYYIKKWYEDGSCTNVKIHKLILSQLECWGCDGKGCECCDFTGNYAPGKEVLFYVFSFETNTGQRFTWHQLVNETLFKPVLTKDDSPEELKVGNSPSDMDYMVMMLGYYYMYEKMMHETHKLVIKIYTCGCEKRKWHKKGSPMEKGTYNMPIKCRKHRRIENRKQTP